MTIFGPDISNNNGPDIDMTRLKREGFDFVFCKVTEGDYFVDATWPAYRDAARANGLLVAGYHYVRGDCDIDAQAELFLCHLGDAPAMFDFEANSGDIDVFWALCEAINKRGKELALSYIPRWYWDQIGRPDISGVPGLIQSSYVGGSGFAIGLYPGDGVGPYWNSFGGRDVDILQFTDAAIVAGHSMDANAFRGTREQLAMLLDGKTAPAPVTVNQEVDMTPEQAQQLQDIWEQIRQPWPQLGVNDNGEPLTLVDAVAAVKAKLESQDQA